MEPVLDETSLVPCPNFAPADRIVALANVLKKLDDVGMSPVLRMVSGAADLDIAQGRGLRIWCSDKKINRDARLLIANRLGRSPFIDGPNGLMARAEGARVLETQTNSKVVYGLGLGALEGQPVASLASSAMPIGRHVQVQVLDASTDPVAVTNVEVFAYVRDCEVAANASMLKQLLYASISSGQALLDCLAKIFPYLRVGPEARESISALSGSEPVFRQLIRHLHALNIAADVWPADTSYQPDGITFSQESDQTLWHGRYGPMREFQTPEGFEHERWSFHTKLTGGKGARLYYRAVRTANTKAILIGYFGDHLPCVRYPT